MIKSWVEDSHFNWFVKNKELTLKIASRFNISREERLKPSGSALVQKSPQLPQAHASDRVPLENRCVRALACATHACLHLHESHLARNRFASSHIHVWCKPFFFFFLSTQSDPGQTSWKSRLRYFFSKAPVHLHVNRTRNLRQISRWHSLEYDVDNIFIYLLTSTAKAWSLCLPIRSLGTPRWYSVLLLPGAGREEKPGVTLGRWGPYWITLPGAFSLGKTLGRMQVHCRAHIIFRNTPLLICVSLLFRKKHV